MIREIKNEQIATAAGALALATGVAAKLAPKSKFLMAASPYAAFLGMGSMTYNSYCATERLINGSKNFTDDALMAAGGLVGVVSMIGIFNPVVRGASLAAGLLLNGADLVNMSTRWRENKITTAQLALQLGLILVFGFDQHSRHGLGKILPKKAGFSSAPHPDWNRIVENPFHSEPSWQTITSVKAPAHMVQDTPKINMFSDNRELLLFNNTLNYARDGYPKEFIWREMPKGGLSKFERLFYGVFDPIRFSTFLAQVTKSPISGIAVGPFAAIKGINEARFIPPGRSGTYTSLNAFFTRRLAHYQFFKGASPADGRLIYLARGKPDQVLNIKGEQISLAALVGPEAAKKLPENVVVAITYLSPKDYHLGHSPFGGTILHTERIPGHAWTVDPKIWNVASIEGAPGREYLIRNARNVVVTGTPHGKQTTVYVAATNVFSTEVHVTPGTKVSAGQHEQTYNLGSTNVYMYDADHVHLAHDLEVGQALKCGETPFVIPKFS